MVVGPQGADANIWMVLISLREGADAGYANVVQPTFATIATLFTGTKC